MEDEVQGKKALWYRILRVLLRVFVIVLALMLVLVIAINIPSVQTFVAGKFIKALREKTGTEISLGSLKIAVPNTVNINDLFLLDKNEDTLLYLHSLSVDVSLFALLKNQVLVKSLALENMVTNIHRKDSTGTFNFQFLVDLFKPDSSIKPDTVVNPRKPWLINVNDITLKNIRATFIDSRGGTDLRVNLGDFIATLKDINLAENKFSIKEVLLKNTTVALTLSLGKGIKTVPEATPVKTDSIGITYKKVKSIFLGLNILADKLTIESTDFSLDNTSSVKHPEGIDYQHLHISNLNAAVRNINIDSEGYRADFENLSLAESCGINVKKLAVKAQLTDQLAELKNLRLETDKSKISGDLSLGYPSFNNFLADLWNSKAKADIGNSMVNADEVFLFVPFLETNTYTGKFKHSDVLISAKADGKINDLDIENIEISALSKTIMKMKGKLTGLPDIKKLSIDATIDQFASNQKDVYNFVDPAVFARFNLPGSFKLAGIVKGNLKSMNADVQLQSASGNITADAFYATQNAARRDTFNIDFTAQDILAGLILSDTMLGKCSFSGNVSGTGITKGPLAGSVNLYVQEALYNSYNYRGIRIESRIADSVITATAGSADTNLRFQLNAGADLRKARQKYSARLDLANLNLQALNFIEKNISVSTNLTGNLNYAGLNNSDATLEFINTTLRSDKKSIPVKTMNITAVSTQDSLSIDMQSDLADGKISGNINSENLPKLLLSAYKKYFGLTDTAQSQPGKHLAFNADVHIPQNILDELIPGLDTLRISKLEGIYKSDRNELNAVIQVPEAIYSNAHMDSLSVVVSGKNEELSVDLQLDKISYNAMKIENFSAKEQINKGEIASEISILDSIGNPRYLFVNEIEMSDNMFSIRFRPGGLILDGESWNVKDGNLLEKRQDAISSQEFVFSKGNQSIGFVADESQRQLSFKDFALQNLVNIAEINGMKDPLKGNIGGEIDFPLPGNDAHINLNMRIDSLCIRDTLAGNLAANIKTTNDKMDIDTHLVNDQNNMSVKGNVDHLSGVPILNLDVLVNINDLYRLEKFSFGSLSEMKGKINAEVSIKGTTQKPDIIGFVGIEKTAFRINSLNFLARIEDEKIQLNSRGIHFDDFVIEDAQSKKLSVNGDILTSNFSDFGVDLHLTTKDFQPMNSTSADNRTFYGKLSIATDIWFKGDVENPDIKAYIKIDSATNLTYALPGSELKLVTSEGIVNFLEPGQKYDSIYVVKEGKSLADSIISRISGINLSANLEIDPNAKFTVDIDPKSGDYLIVSGSTNLKIDVDRAGKKSVTGIYEVKSGLYELSFYNLVKKTFIIAPGSTISWSGNPKDADVNLAANYTVTTPSTSLMANESTTMSETEKNMFKQRLPYNVKLNILGFLSQPQISFNITLPDKYLTANPMVATKLTQLNSADHTDALNKQVFALLVTGGFIADNPNSTGSSPSSVASTAARNSVNGILAGQMNNVTSKFVHNFDLNFGLTTFDDGTTGSTAPTTELDVQVSKKLFNERVTVEAQSSIDLSGNKNTTTTTSDHNSGAVAVTYKLTEDGEYKLKAFSQTAYDLFDGDIISSGLAVMFTREFETLKRKKKVDSKLEKKDRLKKGEGEKMENGK
ncbi:MAG: translocation/assembly module TamB domain-containing protein [Bacteroidota bacterium]